MNSNKPYRDRRHAGMELAKHIRNFSGHHSTIILALPRGGVPVAWEVAHALNLPLDVLIVRKLELPGQPEIAMGAIASGDVTIINHSVTSELPNPAEFLKPIIVIEQSKVRQRELLYRNHKPPLNIQRLHAILVDDGLATGATMRAAAQAVRLMGAASCMVACPVGSVDACRVLGNEVDQLICPLVPADYRGVSEYYENFDDLSDDDVRKILAEDPRATEPGAVPV